MREKSLVYIYTTHGTSRFVGCGVLVEGGLIATCRHVWRMATERQGASLADTVIIAFPHAFRQDGSVRTIGRLADPCKAEKGPDPDLVLLSAEERPIEIEALQLAFDAHYEVGECLAVVGLTGRDPGNPQAVEDVTIEGRLAVTIRADGRRQFVGNNAAHYWPDRGSSGSPLFRPQGQHVAGILSLSELGANAGKGHLHEAFVVRGETIRAHVVRVVADRAARDENIPLSSLTDILPAIGARGLPVAEIPERIRLFVEASRAHAAESATPSNLGGDVDATIDASRALVGQYRPDEALTLLRAKIAEQNEDHARRQVPLLKEQAAVQRIAFDNDGARASLATITQLDPADVWAWIELGDLWMIAGSLAQAGSAYRSAQVAATASGDERDLSVSHSRIGNVLAAQGDGPGALAAYRAGLAIRETLSGRDPSNTQWQRDLSVSHDKVGNVLAAQGDGPGALAAYRAGLAIAETLAGRDPSNTQWQRDLSVSHDKVGDVLAAQGDGPGALAAYRVGLAIRETLSGRDPSNAEWQRDLIVSHVKLSERRPEAARTHLERAAAIAQRLHDDGRLNPVDHWMIDDLAARLAALPETG